MYEEYEELPSGTEVIWPDGLRSSLKPVGR